MPYNLLLLPLLGGYLFIHFTYRFRFRAYGLDNYRLLFESAGFGIAALALSHLLTRLALAAGFLEGPIRLWKRLAPFPFSGSAFGALLLGLLAPSVVNRIWNKDVSSLSAIGRYGNDLERLLHEAWTRKITVLITLSSRKVYVAWVTLSPSLKPSMPFVTILPTMSGYRDKDTLAVTYTTHYTEVYRKIEEVAGEVQGLTAKDFQMVVPTSSIVSASPFSKLPADHFALPAKSLPPGRSAHAED